MKKNLLLAFMITAAGCLSAQSGDVIWGRCADYLYPVWYDECYYYTTDGGYILGEVPQYFGTQAFDSRKGHLYAVRHSLPEPIVVEGIAVMVSIYPLSLPSMISERNTEYAIIMGIDSSGLPRDTLAMARWDTVAPRVMLLPQNIRAEQSGNTTGCMRDFLVYEARFPQPVLVDTLFFVAGTYNSNELVDDGNGVLRYKYQTTSYTAVHATQNPCAPCLTDAPVIMFSGSGWGPLQNYNQVGPFLLIPAGVELTVLTADSLMGTATGSGTYHSGEPVTIEATASRFCRFASWSDGSTDNPRVMYLRSDSTVTANFVHDSSCYVRVLPNNPDWGCTGGAGIYPYGQSVDIAATPFDGFLFTEWADGNRDNPRTVYPTGDTVFTALFDPVPVGIAGPGSPEPQFTVTPNPTQGIVTIGCAKGTHTLQLYDGAGRMVLARTFDGSSAIVDVAALPSGIYTAVLRTAGMKESKTLIKL